MLIAFAVSHYIGNNLEEQWNIRYETLYGSRALNLKGISRFMPQTLVHTLLS